MISEWELLQNILEYGTRNYHDKLQLNENSISEPKLFVKFYIIQFLSTFSIQIFFLNN